MGVHDTDKYAQVKKLLGIPADEPIFILRGQDQFATATLARYRNFASAVDDTNPDQPKQDWFDSLDAHCDEFVQFKSANPDKIKIPD